jgi:hypothetical protein
VIIKRIETVKKTLGPATGQKNLDHIRKKEAENIVQDRFDFNVGEKFRRWAVRKIIAKKIQIYCKI